MDKHWRLFLILIFSNIYNKSLLTLLHEVGTVSLQSKKGIAFINLG